MFRKNGLQSVLGRKENSLKKWWILLLVLVCTLFTGCKKNTQEEDIVVGMDNMNGAINGDTVLVEIINNQPDGRMEGRIVRIVKRELSTVVGEIYFKKERGYIIPDDKKLKMNIVKILFLQQ